MSISQVSQNNAFYDTHKSLPINRAEENKNAWLKVEEGVRLDLEARRRAEEEKKHAWIEAEEEARLVEEASMKA